MTNGNDTMNYGKYIIAWVSIIVIVMLQVVISGVAIGTNTHFFIILLSSIAAFAILSVFMTSRKNKTLSIIFQSVIALELLFVILYDFII